MKLQWLECGSLSIALSVRISISLVTCFSAKHKSVAKLDLLLAGMREHGFKGWDGALELLQITLCASYQWKLCPSKGSQFLQELYTHYSCRKTTSMIGLLFVIQNGGDFEGSGCLEIFWSLFAVWEVVLYNIAKYNIIGWGIFVVFYWINLIATF